MARSGQQKTKWLRSGLQKIWFSSGCRKNGYIRAAEKKWALDMAVGKKWLDRGCRKNDLD